MRDRAVPGISCIKPMAPFLETALGLKFDSTLTTERTKLGSTLCLAADCNTEPMRQHSYAAFVVLTLADVLLAVYA